MHEDDSLTEEEGYVRQIRMMDQSLVLCLIAKLPQSDENNHSVYSAITFFRPNNKWLFGTGETQRDAVEALVVFHSSYTKQYFGDGMGKVDYLDF